MQYSETFQVIIFLSFICFLGYHLFAYMNDKKTQQQQQQKEGFDNNSSSSSSLPGGTTNAASYSNAIKELVQTIYNELYVPNNASLNQQYIQSYNTNLANFKTMVKTVQAHIPLSINFDADPSTINDNVIKQMKVLNTLSTGIQNLDRVNYAA
jgi:hypothetical protein